MLLFNQPILCISEDNNIQSVRQWFRYHKLICYIRNVLTSVNGQIRFRVMRGYFMIITGRSDYRCGITTPCFRELGY